MTSKHTPGPDERRAKVYNRSGGTIRSAGDSRWVVAPCSRNPAIHSTVQDTDGNVLARAPHADAALIAAAPELLAALRVLCEMERMADDHADWERWEAARALLARFDGGSK